MHTTQDIKYKLDLHGETREKAIEKLISFLDQIRHKHKKKSNYTHSNHNAFQHNSKQIMVTIVTGSGSHSQQGPILRTAVEKVLKKRMMTYHLTHKRGAFNVDALSGIELSFDEQGRDSKVILLDDHNDFTLLRNLTERSRSNAVHKYYKDNINSSSEISSSSSSGNLADIIIGDDNPLPSEVAAFDNHVQKAKELSLKDVAREQSTKGKESNEFDKVVELSKQAKKDEEAKEMAEMEKMMAAAIALSKQSSTEQEKLDYYDNDEELKKVMELSMNEAQAMRKNNDQMEQDALEYAIMISQQESSSDLNREDIIEENQLTMDEEERLVQMALKMSKVEYQKAGVL